MKNRLLVIVPFLASMAGGATPQSTPVRPVIFEPANQPNEFVSYSPAGSLRLTRTGLEFASNRGRTIRLCLEGGRRVEPTASDKLASVTHHFIGNDPKQWRTRVANFAKVRYSNVYDGIDLVVYGSNGSFEYDFVVAPNGDPSRIRMRFEGAQKLTLNSDGDLIVEKAGLTQRRPRVFQGHQEIRGRFRVHGRSVSFDLGPYDHTQALIIDPVITYTSFLGGTSFESGTAVTVDKAGNVYVAGGTLSPNFPGPIAFGQRPVASQFAFLSKFAPISGGKTQLLFTVLLGDNLVVDNELGYSLAQGVALDSSGNIIVAGETSTTAFPTKNAIQSHLFGGQDCIYALGEGNRRCKDGFLTKLTPDGTALIFSTYYGGGNDQGFEAVAMDSANNIYVSGYGVGPSSLRGTTGAIQVAATSSLDMLAARFDSNGNLVYSTFLGGTGADDAHAIAVEKPGVVWIGGDTGSKDMPMAAAGTGFQTAYSGKNLNAYLARIDMNQSGASGLTYSTFFNGNINTSLSALFLDPSGQVVFCGATISTDLPVTATAMEPGFIGLPLAEVSGPVFTAGDGYITRINPLLAGKAGLTYSSYIGGSDTDRAVACGLDPKGNFVVFGNTGPLSTDLFLQQGSPIPRKLVLGGSGTSPFGIRINPNAAGGLMDAFFFGGTMLDQLNAVAFDSQGRAYLTGLTLSKDFPVTANAVQRIYGGDDNRNFDQGLFGDSWLMQVDLNAAQVAPTQLIQESGDFQFGPPGQPLPSAIAVHLADANGNPLGLSGFPVLFTGTNATVTDSQVLTDGDGIAKTLVRINGDATVLAAVNISGLNLRSYTFHLKALSGAGPASVAIVSGDRQNGNAGTALPSPLVVELRASDNSALALAGLTVQFKPVNATVSAPTALTDATGRASTSITLGTGAGPSTVQVIVGSLPVATATFNAGNTVGPPPAINSGGVLSAATYQGNAISPGLIAVIFGSNLGPAAIAVNGAAADGKFPTLLAQTRVLFDGVAGAMVYTSSGQVSAIVPYAVEGKTSTQVTVEYQGVASPPKTIAVAAAQLGLFSADSSGRGQGALLNQDNSVNSAANPAKRSSIVVLFGTGEGATNPAGVDGQLAQSVYPKPKQPVTAKINGIPAEVLYYGAAPTLVAGVLQVNVKIPAGVPDGNATVELFEGSNQSPATITVAVKGDQ